MLFKVIGFAGKRALCGIRFFGSLPCGLSKKDRGAQLLVQLLLRPQRPLLDFSPIMGSFPARSLMRTLLELHEKSRRYLPLKKTLFSVNLPSRRDTGYPWIQP